MEDKEPEPHVTLALFLAPGGERQALRVGPGEPGPGDEWHIPPEVESRPNVREPPHLADGADLAGPDSRSHRGALRRGVGDISSHVHRVVPGIVRDWSEPVDPEDE